MTTYRLAVNIDTPEKNRAVIDSLINQLVDNWQVAPCPPGLQWEDVDWEEVTE